MRELGDDLGAALSARKELGDAYERELISAFLEKVDRSVDARIDDRLAARDARHFAPERRAAPATDLMVPFGTLILGLPVSALVAATLGGFYGLVGLGIVWTGLGVVNIAHAFRRRR